MTKARIEWKRRTRKVAKQIETHGPLKVQTCRCPDPCLITDDIGTRCVTCGKWAT